MSHSDQSPREDFDTQLAAHFAREHLQVAEEPFVATAMKAVRSQQRWLAMARTVVQASALIVLVIASPWLTAAVTKLNAILDSSFIQIGNSSEWVLALLAAGVVLALRLRSRQ